MSLVRDRQGNVTYPVFLLLLLLMLLMLLLVAAKTSAFIAFERGRYVRAHYV